MNKAYEVISLVAGLSAVATLVFFLIQSPYHCIIPMEPIWWIRYPEIVLGLLVMPFYINQLIKLIKKPK